MDNASNILRATGDNPGGMHHRLYLWTPEEVKLHMRERNLEMAYNLFSYHAAEVKYFDFIPGSASFTEPAIIDEGNEIYTTEFSAVIAKARKEAIKSLIEFRGTRVIGQVRDLNALSRIIGRLDSPAALSWKTSIRPEYEGLNAIEILLRVTYSKPAAFAKLTP